MVTTTTPPPGIQSKPLSEKHPAKKSKVPATIKPGIKEQPDPQESLTAAVVTLLLVVGLVALVIWAALTGDMSKVDAIWDAYLR